MSRKKSITFARKPRAQTPPYDSADVLGMSVTERIPGNAPKAGMKTSASLGLVGKTVYGTVFCLSYGVVFSVLAIGMLIPGKRIIGQAMVDATASARSVFSGAARRQKKPKHASPKAPASAHAPAGIDDTSALVA